MPFSSVSEDAMKSSLLQGLLDPAAHIQVSTEILSQPALCWSTAFHSESSNALESLGSSAMKCLSACNCTGIVWNRDHQHIRFAFVEVSQQHVLIMRLAEVVTASYIEVGAAMKTSSYQHVD